jgi:hypothetical protein
MKIYLFCPTTGIYQGEDFADPPAMIGMPKELPSGATTIAPPVYGRGETAVFHQSEKRWVVRHCVRLQDWQLNPAHGSLSPGSADSPRLQLQQENFPEEGRS